jgi:CRP/FNR family transcriptional regulator, cyclic AMP receptor protein
LRQQPAPGSFLSLLTVDERSRLHDLGHLRHFPRGAVMMYEGEPGERVMILDSGRAKITQIVEGGRETLLSIRDPGDVMGEIAFVDGLARMATVTALEPVEALVIPSSVFRRHLESAPRVAMALLEVVVRRFRETTAKRTEFTASDTTGRLAARLIELADRYGENQDGGIQITLALSLDELVAWTGASRAGVTKALQTLRDLGWIETSRGRILIRDLSALRSRAA